jgi:hypothetical protein
VLYGKAVEVKDPPLRLYAVGGVLPDRGGGMSRNIAREKYGELHGRFKELYLQPQVTLDKAPRRQVLPKA